MCVRHAHIIQRGCQVASRPARKSFQWESVSQFHSYRYTVSLVGEMTAVVSQANASNVARFRDIVV